MNKPIFSDEAHVWHNEDLTPILEAMRADVKLMAAMTCTTPQDERFAQILAALAALEAENKPLTAWGEILDRDGEIVRAGLVRSVTQKHEGAITNWMMTKILAPVWSVHVHFVGSDEPFDFDSRSGMTLNVRLEIR